MDLKGFYGHTISRYIHNIKGFYKNFTYLMSINITIVKHNLNCPYKNCENSLCSSLSLLVKSIKEEI